MNAIVNTTGNSWSDNTYNGPWQFDLGDQNQTFANDATWAKWTSGFKETTDTSNTGKQPTYVGQDSGSTYNPTKLN